MYSSITIDQAALTTLRPFSEEALEVCAELSKRLLREQTRPDLVALGFWLRESNIGRLEECFLTKQRLNCLLLPRGLVFHVPPANVEVMAIYSLIPSLLVGNANILRWPTTTTPLLREMVEAVLPLVDGNTRFVSYGHRGGDHGGVIVTSRCEEGDLGGR